MLTFRTNSPLRSLLARCSPLHKSELLSSSSVLHALRNDNDSVLHNVKDIGYNLDIASQCRNTQLLTRHNHLFARTNYGMIKKCIYITSPCVCAELPQGDAETAGESTADERCSGSAYCQRMDVQLPLRVLLWVVFPGLPLHW